MTKDEIKSNVITIIAEKLGGLSEDMIATEKNLRDDLGMDSLDEIELIMECEKQFDLSIPDGEAEAIKTVKDVIDAVEKHLPVRE
jgi:acyl carrier protein